MYAGIDYSMTCPSITVSKSKDFKDCRTFFYTNNKKFYGVHDNHIIGMMNFPYETEIERFDLIARWAMSILSEFNVQQVCLEGYAMGAKGKVFGIAENTGILKHAMWKAGIQVFTPSPMTVKKYFTGKGNSNKIAMHETFVEKTGIVITEIFNQKADKSPTSDVVDSYAMLCYGIDNYFK